MIRLHSGSSLTALPIFLPRDAAIPAAEVPARPSFTRTFVDETQLLQREKTGGSPGCRSRSPTRRSSASPSRCWPCSPGPAPARLPAAAAAAPRPRARAWRAHHPGPAALTMLPLAHHSLVVALPAFAPVLLITAVLAVQAFRNR